MGEEEKKAEGSDVNIIVLTVFMHCEGCARKVRRCLKGFQGVQSVETDCRSHRVVVKGEKADPLKVLGRLQSKTHRRVELISPIPNPQPLIENPKPPVQQPPIISVALKVHMHCEACAQEIKRRIHRMKGVESVDPDVKTSEVRVKGAFDPTALVDFVHRRTGKHAAIIVKELEPELITKPLLPTPENNDNSELEEKLLEEKKEDAGSVKCKVDEEIEVEEKAASASTSANVRVEEVEAAVEVHVEEAVNKNEYYNSSSNNDNVVSYPQSYILAAEMYPYPPPPMIIAQQMEYPLPPVTAHAYPPQTFSDENPNACSIM